MGRKNNGRIYLIRGISGSGKSILADLIGAGLKANGQNFVSFSTDDFWQDGDTYNFDAERLREAHNWNEDRVLQAMEGGVPNIIVPNTMVSEQHLMPYISIANMYGYEVQVLTVQRDTFICEKENVHNVPANVIHGQAQKLELIGLDGLLKMAHYTNKVGASFHRKRLDAAKTANAIKAVVPMPEVVPAVEPEAPEVVEAAVAAEAAIEAVAAPLTEVSVDDVAADVAADNPAVEAEAAVEAAELETLVETEAIQS